MDDSPVLILGSNGNIAKTLASIFPSSTIIPRQEYLTWLDNGVTNLNSIISNQNLAPKFIFNCVGITNPAFDESLLLKLNYELPKLLLSSTLDEIPKIITFGTVMENIQKYALTNNYLKSKFLFREWLLHSNQNSNFLHLQLHTLYGGPRIHEHMFLGQIHSAIKNRKPFSMSAGIQIREYHHIHDDANAALDFLRRGMTGILPISHGDPIKLCDLAEYIFGYFDSQNLLEVGKLEANEFDALSPISLSNQDINMTQFRDTKAGIIEWLSANLQID